MIKNDKWIREMASQGMISPFEPNQVRQIGDQKFISYGTSSYGYDLRLSPADFRIFRHIPGEVIDPKNFNPQFLEPASLHTCAQGEYFIVPGHSYGLGVSVERFEIPENITVICMGKSTYARCSLIGNVTPGEAGWKGHFTLEFSNSSSADCRIYANEGVIQLLFLEGEPCEVSYETRKGKYQNQGPEVTLARL